MSDAVIERKKIHIDPLCSSDVLSESGLLDMISVKSSTVSLLHPRHETFPTHFIAKHAGAGRACCKTFTRYGTFFQNCPTEPRELSWTPRPNEERFPLSAGMQSTALRGDTFCMPHMTPDDSIFTFSLPKISSLSQHAPCSCGFLTLRSGEFVADC